jgi:alpha-glucosidase
MNFRGILVSAIVFFSVSVANATIKTIQYKNSVDTLTFEILNDQLLHFEYSPLASAPSLSTELKTTPFVYKVDYVGPQTFSPSNNSFQTQTAHVDVDPATLCFDVTDLKQNVKLTHICQSSTPNGYELTIAKNQTQNIYGLGEQFQSPGVTNHDWSGRVRTPPYKFGNGMDRFGGGGLENAQFPILYALGPDSQNFALYLDTVVALNWDFTADPWKITQLAHGSDPSLRGYFIVGEDLPALRTQFMDLMGHPLVPPKKAFGLWVSEYGYRNWNEIENKLNGLRAGKFPVDGFVSDLYWFGGVATNSPTSAMGTLDWDLKNFPNPAKQVQKFDRDDGVGLMLIEESYISKGLANYTSMANRGFLVRNNCATCDPTIYNAWWGEGAGIDWTIPQAGAAWHNEHRKKLTDIGITFHWTDLGEPENWIDQNIYSGNIGGKSEADAHNTYNFFWHKSIYDGYVSNNETKRHFILSRSGAPGMQRFGSAMWSGDIGSNMDSLAAHLNVQMNMSLCGMDFFGADTGGFVRAALVGDVNEVYSRWLAHSSLFDVPVRPHTDNGSKQNETSPAAIGSVESNLFNLRQRYELAPYYYSLAYLAHQNAEPMIPPLVYYYQTDPNVRIIADEKMIGRDLLAATAAVLGDNNRGVYLPKGVWTDYHTLESYTSQGQWFANFQMENNGVFSLPLFAREGAIIPKAFVDDKTMNMLGRRLDGSVVQDLIVEVFPSTTSSSFHLFEDDGTTEDYQQGLFADTRISQVRSGNQVTITIAPAMGAYVGAPSVRKNQVDVVPGDLNITHVTLNGQSLYYASSPEDFARTDNSWTRDPRGVVHAHSGAISVNQSKVFVLN